jgi:hypothetical protein
MPWLVETRSHRAAPWDAFAIRATRGMASADAQLARGHGFQAHVRKACKNCHQPRAAHHADGRCIGPDTGLPLWRGANAPRWKA